MKIESNWLLKEVSLYNTHRDNKGNPATYLDILYHAKNNDILKRIRSIDNSSPEYKKRSIALKSQLACFTPAALLKCKSAGNVTVLNATGIMQLDFDYQAVKDYDLEELKKAVFALPFIGYCGLSCSGNGFYALALIAEPERLDQYAEHCFQTFKSYGINPDESKGKKVENLRYVSFDENRLIRKNPKPLIIRKFRTKKTFSNSFEGSSAVTEFKQESETKLIKDVEIVEIGNRWATVQRAAFTLGGTRNPDTLQKIKDAILDNEAFTGEEQKYFKCAEDCFAAGSKKPIVTYRDLAYWED